MPEKFEREALFLVYTNPSRKRSFSKLFLLTPEEFEKTLAGKSHYNRDVIVFKQLRFKKGICHT